MLCKELGFFADVKRKVVKTHGHVYEYSAKSYGNFSKVRENESFLHKSDVITTVLVQLNVN